MGAEVTVVTDALVDEAAKWRDLADQVAPVRDAADGLDLGVTAFFIGDQNALVHSRAYDDFQDFMVTVLSGAAVEFDQLAGALVKIAKEYDKADAIVSLDLNQIYSA
ncbi:hypothetical protein [Catellatospora citrea]|uniref:Excreted virulence factor EspC (Type VII ESX diderm) n=1 Tax=Catellatospora citrea TaxID=53366 RepID=A0A8J3KCJ0_9ACTN|nr:hypothetical protein [Catellatospora citrea]RKE00469.1 hypothetical protein C8E86_8342 [Catellatospora citrea]GIF98129.1 hypothetical protein Cci01nite_32230 [Catellatospora citrea]